MRNDWQNEGDATMFRMVAKRRTVLTLTAAWLLAVATALLMVMAVVAPLSVLKAVEENQDGAGLDAKRAPPVDKKTALLVDQAADRFAGCLASLKLSFLTETRLDAIRNEVRGLAGKCEPGGMAAADKEKLLAGIDKYVARQFPKRSCLSARSLEERAYLQLPDKVRTFEWLFWVALTRKPLSPELSQVRQQQRKWLREFLESVPVRPGDGVPIPGMQPEEVRPWAMDQLEQQFSDPLSLLNDPMTGMQFENFKRLMGDSAANGLNATAGDIPARALEARVQLHPATADETFAMPLPFDDKPVSVYGGPGFVEFASNNSYRATGGVLDGWREYIGPGGRKMLNRTVFDAIGGTRLQVPEEIAGAGPTPLPLCSGSTGRAKASWLTWMARPRCWPFAGPSWRFWKLKLGWRPTKSAMPTCGG